MSDCQVSTVSFIIACATCSWLQYIFC